MNIKFLKKSNKAILSILLLCITYSFSYAITYNLIYDDECTTISEYIEERTQLIIHDDLCDTQKQFHNYFILNLDSHIYTYDLSPFEKPELTNSYLFKLSNSILKPPTT